MIEPAASELPPDRDNIAANATSTSTERHSLYGTEEDQDELSKKLFAMARAAVNHAATSDLSKRRSAMARSYRAYANEHSEGSKYKHKNYSSRSKLHVPKTRSAVKSKMVAAHAALFGTDDVVAISPSDDTDPGQQASAELNKQILNYRLDRTSHKAGIPWFRIAMGAALDTCVAGICLTKQYWQFKEVLKEAPEEFDESDPMLDRKVVGMNGRPMRRKVLRDRPMIEPHAPENVIVDMAAPWWDVIQEGAFLIVKVPMHVGDVKAMMKPGAQHMGGGPWFNIPEKVMASAIDDVSGTSVRNARNQGSDRYGRMASPPVNDFSIVWVHENFVRYNDCDYHFWALGTKQLLSEPGELGTKGHYPAQHGERPYVMGVGSIEPHNALPMSHVEAWRPLQDQGNDLINLYIDAMKQNIAPIAMYRRGANVDLRAVRERGPDATIQVSDLERDLKFDRSGGADPAALDMMDRLNSEFNELAGNFGTSTVQSSRSLNETVGGMNLFSNAASSVAEFDNQVFLQTWAEPVLRHVVWLEQYYETDETLLALAGKKGELYQRFGGAFVDPQTGQPAINPKTGEPIKLDDILEREITVKVNVGPGAGDPNQKMARINAALDMSLKVAPLIQGQAQMMAEPFLKEVWSITGISADRIIKFTSVEEAAQNQPPDPNAMKMENDSKRIELEARQQEIDAQLAQEKNALEREKLELEKAKIAGELQKLEDDANLKAAQIDQSGMAQEKDAMMKDRDFGLRERESERNAAMQEEEGRRANSQAETETKFRALDAAMQLPNPEEQQAESETQGQLMQALGQITEALQKLTEQQMQTDETLGALVAQQQAKQRMVHDGMGRTIPVEPR